MAGLAIITSKVLLIELASVVVIATGFYGYAKITARK